MSGSILYQVIVWSENKLYYRIRFVNNGIDSGSERRIKFNIKSVGKDLSCEEGK